MTNTEKLAALLREIMRDWETPERIAEKLAERGVMVQNNTVACVNCKGPVGVTALNALQCEKCGPSKPKTAPPNAWHNPGEYDD
jgi:hypothetical protein